MNLAYKQNQKNWQINSNIAENLQLKSELEKQQLLNRQQAQEIVYLRGLIDSLLKKEIL